MHEKKIMHNDLYPINILINDKFDKVCLIDFGKSKMGKLFENGIYDFYYLSKLLFLFFDRYYNFEIED